MEINSDSDVAIADALVQLRKAVDDETRSNNGVGGVLALALDQTNPGWREKPEWIERVRAIGVREASNGLLKRYGL